MTTPRPPAPAYATVRTPVPVPSWPPAVPVPAERPKPDRVLVEPAPNSRLESLLTLYAHMKAEYDAAEERFEDLKRGIAEELEKLPVQPAHAYDIPAHPRGLYPALLRFWVASKRIDTKRLKAELPQVWEAYSTESGHWTLKKS